MRSSGNLAVTFSLKVSSSELTVDTEWNTYMCCKCQITCIHISTATQTHCKWQKHWFCLTHVDLLRHFIIPNSSLHNKRHQVSSNWSFRCAEWLLFSIKAELEVKRGRAFFSLFIQVQFGYLVVRCGLCTLYWANEPQFPCFHWNTFWYLSAFK